MDVRNETDERVLALTVDVEAPRGEVWDAWTTEEGIRTFFAPNCTVDLRSDGKYELLWDLDAPAGMKGSEGCVVLAVQSEQLLSFTWNAPTKFPKVRDQRTVVILRFSDLSDDRTRLSLTHIGWGDGDQWDDAYEYFRSAWGDVVLPNLQRRFVEGPLVLGEPK